APRRRSPRRGRAAPRRARAAAARAPSAAGSAASSPHALHAGELAEAGERLLEGGLLVQPLAQEGLDVADLVEGAAGPRSRAALVGADQDQVAVLLVGREQLAEPARRLEVTLAGHRRHDAAGALEDVDGGVVAAGSQLAGEDD